MKPTDERLRNFADSLYNRCLSTVADELLAILNESPWQGSEIRLWDSQWSNIVNHDNCYRDFSKDEAVAHPVKMTEAGIARNFEDGKFPPKKSILPTPPKEV